MEAQGLTQMTYAFSSACKSAVLCLQKAQLKSVTVSVEDFALPLMARVIILDGDISLWKQAY